MTTDSRGERSPMPGPGLRATPNPPLPWPGNHSAGVQASRALPAALEYTGPLDQIEPGFYVVPYSMSPKALLDSLFDNLPPSAMGKFSALNPGLDGPLKAGSMIVLGSGQGTACTWQEAQLMQAAEEVRVALEPLTPQDADDMVKHRAVIAAFTGDASTWGGVTATVLEKHLGELRKILMDVETLHQNTYNRDGHLKSNDFFKERKRLLKKLDDHLLNSTRLRGKTSLGDHFKLKSALGISSRSLVHHWKQAGTAGQIPGYANHVKAMTRATRFMQAGGYVGISLGGLSSVLAVQELCAFDPDAPACRKAKYTESTKFLGSAAGGYAAGNTAYLAGGTICAALGLSTGVGGVLCVGLITGGGSWLGTTLGAIGGEKVGDVLYEKVLR